MKGHNIDVNRRKFLGSSAVTISTAALVSSGLLAHKNANAQSSRRPELVVVGSADASDLAVERVTYANRNTKTEIAANLFKPPGFDGANKYPAVVIVHPIGGVKEQTAGLYALHLARKGYITLAFDATYQGDSGGEPRLMELPAARVDDVSSSIDFLSAHANVNPDRIGLLGICGGGGYALNAAQTELRIKAVATVSAADIGGLRRSGLGGSRQSAERIKLLKEASLQRSLEAQGGPVRLTATVPESAKDFTSSTPVMYREGFEYYRTSRGRHPNAVCRAVFSTLPAQMAFYAFEALETISPRPILMIAGDKADSLYFSQDAYSKAIEPKELFLVAGATHIDMYDKRQYVVPAVHKLSSFFDSHLV
ncbi:MULTISPECIES: alpha/beta hydrolase [Xanthomonas]|uniref:alpha/beta hydrolase n=1 Tax=Xanthomonas TaxID=338 RepID=UPI000CEDC700|nr:alpha/beta hydrolase [Xanthomonas arboricola]PPT86627.1 hypothetical protein XarbCFBP8149_16135 [Xanthomonas arboricola]PPU47852.1 hypothetical protein XarbCFBP7697_03395 [Xanthomonas arboricola]